MHQALSHRTRALAAVALSVPLLVGGCSDTSDDTAADTTTTIATDTTVASDGASSGTTETTSADATGTDGTTGTVNANDASIDELAAAFEAAGVPNAERWAHEVDEYRPYTDDGWAHLRQELSKYNIDDATFDKIVATLEL